MLSWSGRAFHRKSLRCQVCHLDSFPTSWWVVRFSVQLTRDFESGRNLVSELDQAREMKPSLIRTHSVHHVWTRPNVFHLEASTAYQSTWPNLTPTQILLYIFVHLYIFLTQFRHIKDEMWSFTSHFIFHYPSLSIVNEILWIHYTAEFSLVRSHWRSSLNQATHIPPLTSPWRAFHFFLRGIYRN